FLGDARIPIDFTTLGFGGSLTVASAGGREDELLINASDPANLNAIFTVTAAGTVTLTSPAFPAQTRELVDGLTPGVTSLRLNAFGGDDTFNLASNHPFAGGVSLLGAEPDGNDTLNVTGGGATQTVSLANVTLANRPITITETGFGAIQFSGIEAVNVLANGGSVAVTGSAAVDNVRVAPTLANANNP